MTTVREFRRSDQPAARALLEHGLGEHFGFIDRERARLVRVGVAREHRRAGVASALLDAAIELAATAAIRELIAYTQPEWTAAMAFYRAHGFAPYGRDDVDVHLRRRL